MNLSIKEAGTARQIATVTFDAEEIQTKEKEACNEIGKVANIPGFRKGKAPSNVIRKRFSKELNDELTRKLSTEAYESIMENKDFKVYSILKLSLEALIPIQALQLILHMILSQNLKFQIMKIFKLPLSQLRLQMKTLIKN